LASLSASSGSEAAISPPNSAKPPDPLLKLRAGLDSMEKVARAAGIEADEPLGVWIGTLKFALEHSIQVSLGGEERVLAVVAELREVAREDRRRMKAAVELCEAATQKLEATYGTMEIRSHNMMTQTIHSMAGQVADRMREQMVIVERRHNRVALWRRIGLLTAVVVLIFGLGFGAARYADQAGVGLLDRCLAHPLLDSQTGELLCALEAARSGG
jgi:hypothetical protein